MKHIQPLDEMCELVRQQLWNSAFDVARHQIAAGEDYRYWQTQLAAAMFLDERDPYTQYQCLPILDDLRESFPEDHFVAFVRAYCTFILKNTKLEDELVYAAEYLDVRSYALIALLGDNHDPKYTQIFEEVLRIQPLNIYAHLSLGHKLKADGQIARARLHLEAVASIGDPYVERGLGVLSEYLNIYTGGLYPERIRRAASVLLTEIDEAS